ncbi:septal ring lytic transglycosylase RlpA family protein [Mesorhizobium sp. WSM2239]|uniref:Endolytic peptidoglycan transglycosylase RlpA n=2 Tax=unclassified Mesorhizobium TaxID=325217 RepID=A0AAU8D3G1_9HYPH
MLNLALTRPGRASAVAALAIAAVFLAACGAPQSKGMVNTKNKRSKEYFAESEYGVKASPRVTTKKSNLQRGGGRDQLGRPYKVRGKMYYPKEDKNYKKVGAASWYGDAFHGRLTANGEVYDMTHLTAAHPTMPLPSYARVTNLKNGSSIIVRVNDRGPYSHGRLIDLSKRAAELLDYTHIGTAKVQVEYVGRAPLHGRDDQYLMASYRPGNRAPDPSDGLASGVMIAMNGPTPSADAARSAAFPGVMSDSAPAAQPQVQPVMAANAGAFGDLALPAFGPIAPERPGIDMIFETQVALATMSYAPNQRLQSAAKAFAALERGAMSPDDVAQSWKRLNPAGADAALQPYVAAGSFATLAEAQKVARVLSGFGRATLETSEIDGAQLHSVNLYSDGRNGLDAMLEAAWANGAPDAMTIRD